MKLRRMSIARLAHVVALVFTLSCGAVTQAELVDFETDGDGAPSGAFIDSDEYAALGMLIRDSDSGATITFLDDTNPANVGTPITGKYANVGAFQDVATFIELRFPIGVTSLGFHWATGAGASEIQVALFDGSDTQIGATIHDPATMDFVAPSGATLPSGAFSTVTATPIRRVLIEDEVGARRALAIDNVRFEQVPEPSMLGLALVAMLGIKSVSRRR